MAATTTVDARASSDGDSVMADGYERLLTAVHFSILDLQRNPPDVVAALDRLIGAYCDPSEIEAAARVPQEL